MTPNEKTYWFLALLLFVIGDSLTTFVGLSLHGIVEANPVAVGILAVGGFAFMTLTKLLVVSVAALGFRLSPSSIRQGIPIGLALVGCFVTVWNLSVIGRILI